MSCKFLSLLNASMGASVKICFILSDVCNFCMCFHRIRRMFGSALEKVMTCGTLLVLLSLLLYLRRSVVVSQVVCSFRRIYLSQFVFNKVCVVPSVLEVALKVITVA